MHLLQWMQSDEVAVPACMRLGRSGSRSRARAIATNAKPSASAGLDRRQLGDAAEEDERRGQRARNWRAKGRKKASS